MTMENSVFITGASSGIGLATAIALDAAGWRIFAGALPDDDFSTLEAATSQRVTLIKIDITKPEDVQHAYEQIKAEDDNMRLSALVNNAGIQIAGPLETLSIEQLQRQFEVNVYGHLRLIQTFLPMLSAGRIVNVSSMMGKVALPTLGAYSMSKHALEAMSDVLRFELAMDNIDVITIEMGAIKTPMTAGMVSLYERILQAMPPQLADKYHDLMTGMQDVLKRQATSPTAPEKVAQAIIKALTVKHPRPRYIIGADAAGLIAMRRYAPDHIGDAILRRALGLNDRKRQNDPS